MKGCYFYQVNKHIITKKQSSFRCRNISCRNLFLVIAKNEPDQRILTNQKIFVGGNMFALYFFIETNNLIWSVSIVGVIANIFNICFLVMKRQMLDFSQSFTNVLLLLAAFDILYLLSGILIFGLPAVSGWYSMNVYAKILPTW